MTKAKIYYFTLTDEMRREEKLDWFASSKFQDIPFEHIQPDKNANWIDLTDNDWDELIPVANKGTKLSKNKNEENAVFKLNTLGVVTARDEWVLDFDKESLINKVNFLINTYNDLCNQYDSDSNKIINQIDKSEIKLSRDVIKDLKNKIIYEFDRKDIRIEFCRPYVKKYIYFNAKLNEMQYKLNDVYKNNHQNLSIIFSAPNSNVFSVIISDRIFEYKSVGTSTGGTESVSLYRYDTNGNRYENITDWGLSVFREKYGTITNDQLLITNEKTLRQAQGDKKRITDNGQQITKEDIFYYTYAVLHNPAYRKKYELNLKREFPRLPFYDDFWQWRNRGKELMDLHINFEQAEKYPLQIVGSGFDKARTPNAKLRADKENGFIILDEQTSLIGIPKEAWQYKLGNRSALEWILDQYKEKKPKDPTIREKFNTYKFSDYKEKVIDLLMRVTTVSIKTMKIVNSMNSKT